MKELTGDDRSRLTSLLHGYGSVAALEQALGQPDRPLPTASPPIALADLVRTEVAHQLGRQHGYRCRADVEGVDWAVPPLLTRCRHLLWPASGVAWITLTLIVLGGVPPAGAAATGILGILGLHLGLRRDGGLGRLLWQAVAAACVIAWALTSSWPLEASALVLGSVLAGCIADPIRSKLGQTGTL
jgi:hypothetical protein